MKDDYQIGMSVNSFNGDSRNDQNHKQAQVDPTEYSFFLRFHNGFYLTIPKTSNCRADIFNSIQVKSHDEGQSRVSYFFLEPTKP